MQEGVYDDFVRRYVEEVKKIEYFIGQKIPRLKLDGFDYLFTVLFDDAPPASRRKKRR